MSTRKLIGKPGDPESLSLSLAHVVVIKEGEDVILGQAWLAAANTLVTCGHVVEQFKRNPAEVTVQFPLSGNRYIVREIKLHPTYGKKGNEQLIRFDVAKLTVDLMAPDNDAPLLPITFDKYDGLPNQQTLQAIRYPSHLGQLTTSQFPLAQVGRYLGPLKKADRFHLLHDLALSPGDSGSPIFDGDTVVAIHCGDTATLPGLNLPTTSIRLAVSVDALRALDLSETKVLKEPNLLFALGPGLFAFLLTTIISFVVVSVVFLGPMSSQWMLKDSDVDKVAVVFNKPINSYKMHEEFRLSVIPKARCFLRVFYTEGDTALILSPHPKSTQTSEVTKGGERLIDGYGKYKLRTDSREEGEIHFFIQKEDLSLLNKKEKEGIDPENYKLPISAQELLKRIKKLEKQNPNGTIYQILDSPKAQVAGVAGDSNNENDEKKSKEDESAKADSSEPSEGEQSKSEEGDIVKESAERHEKVVDDITAQTKETTESSENSSTTETTNSENASENE